MTHENYKQFNKSNNNNNVYRFEKCKTFKHIFNFLFDYLKISILFIHFYLFY